MTVPVLITDLSTTALLNAPSGEDAPSTLDNIQRAHAAFIAKLRDESQVLANKDASGGYAGLTLFKLNLRNAANTFTSFLTNAATAVRTWAMQDRDGTVAFVDDITGGTRAGSFTTLTASGAATFPAGAQITGAALLGYGTGAGGTVTQPTDKGTSFTLNKPFGKFTMAGVSLGAGASIVFSCTNVFVTDACVVVANIVLGSVADLAAYRIEAVGAGSSGGARIIFRLTNLSASALVETPVINFAILNGATA